MNERIQAAGGRSNPLRAHRGARASGLGVLATLALLLPVAVQAAPPYPNSMASTGDSITRAYNTGWFPYSDNPSGSWSTGTNSTVQSHYTRLLKLNPVISGKNYNDAKSGAKMIDLTGQMTTVVSQKVDHVTVLMGGNDICTSSEATMTTTAAFETQFRAAMLTLSTGLPTTRVFVASIPSVKNLWSVLKGSSSARSVWSLFKVCPSMLANPLSTASADVDRRTRVNDREVAFNAILRTVCLEYASTCTYDADAVFNYAFTAADVSTRDYFHPSLAGQKTLAAVTWPLSYGAP